MEEDDVYDDVDEDAYQELVRKRREDNFIEDDGEGDGYIDFGQDDFDDAEYSGDENPLAKRAKGEKGQARKAGVFNSLAPKKKKATERVNGMFLGAGRDVIGPAKAGGKAGGKEDAGGEEASRVERAGDVQCHVCSLFPHPLTRVPCLPVTLR